MKTMAFLTMLIGAFETFNAMAEGWSGGIARHDGAYLLGLAAATLSSALLLAAGVALLRRGRAAERLASAAAIGFLFAFALIAVARPMMSVFATMLGVGFPIVLLIFLHLNRGAKLTVAAS